MRIPFVLLTALAVLSGCGFKGPLYIPERTSQTVKPPAQQPATPVTPAEQRPVPSEAIPAPK